MLSRGFLIKVAVFIGAEVVEAKTHALQENTVLSVTVGCSNQVPIHFSRLHLFSYCNIRLIAFECILLTLSGRLEG